jgi:hypothetical protein
VIYLYFLLLTVVGLPMQIYIIAVDNYTTNAQVRLLCVPVFVVEKKMRSCLVNIIFGFMLSTYIFYRLGFLFLSSCGPS